MDDALYKRIPKDPHWRWVAYHEMMGREHEDIDERYRKLARFLSDRHDEQLDQFEEIGLRPLLEHSKDGRDDIAEALDIRDTLPIKKVVRRMLLEHCDPEWIQDALYHKFKTNVSLDGIEAYQTFWWDTETLQAYDMAEYYHGRSQSRPDPPPVPGDMRDQYVAYNEGASVNLNPAEAVEDVLVHAYFRSKELAQFGIAGDDEVRKYQKNVLAAFRALEEHNEDSGPTEGLPSEIEHKVVYPDGDTAASMEDLGNYDPGRDAGHDDDTPAYKEDES
ncbi:MAG: hypothetical protein ABEN55_10860 [Bradymonadaceae bacterium]